MIPRFKKEGYLPQGIYKATLDEIRQRFGISSERRKELFECIISVAELLRKHKNNIERFLLDGSFVTTKESPEDFDCILVIKEAFDFKSPEASKLKFSKELFNGHIVFIMEKDIKELNQFIGFFGHDRDGIPKGLVEVIL